MTSRLLRISGLIVLGTVLFLPFLEPSHVFAQGGRNIFERRNTAPTSRPRPKADDATRQRLNQSFQNEFSTGLGDIQTYLYYVVFLVFLGVLIFVLVRYDRYRRQNFGDGVDNPQALFRELCAAHQLTGAERRFLRNFAEDLDLADPLPLFIEPDYFYRALDDGKDYEPFEQTIRYLLIKLFDIKLAREAKTTDSSDIYTPESVDKHTETTVLVPSRRAGI